MILLSLAGILAVAVWETSDEDLCKATQAASEMSSYAFKVDVKADRRARGLAPLAVEGKYEKDQPVYFKAQGTDAYRRTGAVVVKDGEAWKRLERKKREKKDRNQTTLLSLGDVKLPHEELTEFEKKLEKIEKAVEGETTVYSGALTADGARSLAATGNKASGKGRLNLTYSGSAKLWLNKDGQVTKYEVSIKGSGKVKERDVQVSTTRTVELSEIGTVKVEVPEAAKKSLQGS
jgi:hypothetical protein